MNCNIPTSFNKLPKSERDAIEKYFNEQLNHLLDKEEAEVQEILIKLACINLKENCGLDEEALCKFIIGWNRIYRRNARTQTKAEQTAWLEEEMKKCFPKFGFPQARIDHLKEKVC